MSLRNGNRLQVGEFTVKKKKKKLKVNLKEARKTCRLEAEGIPRTSCLLCYNNGGAVQQLQYVCVSLLRNRGT